MVFSIEAWAKLEYPSDVQLSPDGQRIAFVYGSRYKADKDTPLKTTIHLIGVTSGTDKPFITEECTNISPRWSPDGHQLAFLSNRANKDEMQLYVIDLDSSEMQQLTDLRGDVHAPVWMGSALLFLYGGTLEPDSMPDPDPVLQDKNPRFNRVWCCDTASIKALTPETTHIFEYALSPDGSMLAVLAGSHPNPMEGWYAAQLYTVNINTQAMQQVCTIEHQAGRLTWSPDSTQIAYVSGIMSDEGNISGEVYRVAAAGGEPCNLTPGLDHSITWIEWRLDGIFYGGRRIDHAVLGRIDALTGAISLIVSGPYTINGTGPQCVSVARDGSFAAVRSSFTEPQNIYLGSPDGKWRQISKFCADESIFPPLHVENRHWVGPDNMPVQGFLVYPFDYKPGQTYPLFVHVHGGPGWSYMPDYYLAWERLMVERGCLVLMPNPRGSWGRGHAYQSANVGDLGGGDWQDIYAGIDPLIEEGLVDPDRIAIGGWSYGGYLTAWAITQTDRFRCAIAGASITNYVSNYGVVSNREWQTTMFGSYVYDAMELHCSRSPISYVSRVKTPTLLVHGAQDQLAPPEQAIEFYTALRHYEIPAQLALYPREPHGFQEQPHQIDLMGRIAAWVDRYLLEKS